MRNRYFKQGDKNMSNLFDIYYSVDCISCGKPVKKRYNNIKDNSVVSLHNFEHTEWKCEDCKTVTCIDDIRNSGIYFDKEDVS
jgi:hypothetical protein